MLAARRIRASDLVDSITALRVVTAQELPEENARIAAEYIEYALSRIDDGVQEPPHLAGDDPLALLGRDYLDALLRGERRVAATRITDSVAGGTSLTEIYLRVFQPVLYEIGRRWQANEITVAQEHYCSAATQLIMSQLYPLIFKAERRGKTLVAASAPATCMKSDYGPSRTCLKWRDGTPITLAPMFPIPDLLSLLVERHADVLALSATMRLTSARFGRPSRRCELAECAKLLILVGRISIQHRR